MEEELVPNRYLAAVKAERLAAAGPRWDLCVLLKDAERAMEAGAWVSSQGDRVHEELSGRGAGLRARADQVLEVFDDAISQAGQQPWVAPESWYHRWDSWAGY